MSHEDSCDLTQAFFARFLEKRYLRSVDADLGKFRTFLPTSSTRFLANEWDRLFYDEIANTVRAPDAVESEIRRLLAVLSD